MKHCHFSILWNELPFLKQKLPFLYKYFDQIIFFDLNIKTFEFSDDGGHEFIKNFPDPENKISLIEKKDLSDITEFEGQSFEEKQKMFAAGSSIVNNDIDVFWCTDMDEFFEKSLIKDVEFQFENYEVSTLVVPHIIYFYNEKFIFSNKSGEDTHPLSFARIGKHVPGRIHGHCTLQKYTPIRTIKNQFLHHFAFVGENRMKFKAYIYKQQKWYENVWKTFDPEQVPKDNTECFGHYHPGMPLGIKYNNKYKIPEYINVQEMMEDLNNKTVKESS